LDSNKLQPPHPQAICWHWLQVCEIAERDQQAAAAAEEQAKRDADKAALEAARESGKLKLSSIGLTEEEIKAFGF